LGHHDGICTNSLPETEEKLQNCLGNWFIFADWKLAFDAILAAEDDTPAAVAAIDSLCTTPVRTINSTATPARQILQLNALETDLMDAIAELKTRKRIVGTAPSLKDLLNPVQEREIGDSQFRFPGGDSEILAQAVHEARGEDPSVADDESDEESEMGEDGLSYQEGMELCEKLEKACVIRSNVDGVAVLDLQRQLRKMRIHFRWLETDSRKQSTLDTFWSKPNMPLQ
jgi:hypothetical protein